jgi:hypothetical protein
MESGTINRTTASTNMNATSSRSHMVITIRFEQVKLLAYKPDQFLHKNYHPFAMLYYKMK